MGKIIWDFDTINREVPIESVLEMHGIYPNRAGKYRLRDNDNTPSASIHRDRKYGNTIHDFGYGNTFNPLTLTMYLQGVDIVEASRILGEAFHVPPKYTSEELEENAHKMMDFEWRAIGIQPDLATMNIDMDLEKYGVARTARFAERFKMPMSELRDRALGKVEKGQEKTVSADDWDKKWYENILRNRAVPFVQEKRDEYFRTMHDHYQLVKAVNGDMTMDAIFQIHKEEYRELASDLAKSEAALEKAVDGTSVQCKVGRYFPADDFVRVVRGEISFEIGSHRHAEVSKAAKLAKAKVFSCVVSLAEYFRLLENGMEDMLVAARQKGEQVGLFFSSVDAGMMNYLIIALRGKEIAFSENFGEALAVAREEKQDNVQVAEQREGREDSSQDAAGRDKGRSEAELHHTDEAESRPMSEAATRYANGAQLRRD